MNKYDDEWINSKSYRSTPKKSTHITLKYDPEVDLQKALKLEVKPWRFRAKNIKHRVKAKFCLCCGEENLKIAPTGHVVVCKSCGCWYRLPGDIEQ